MRKYFFIVLLIAIFSYNEVVAQTNVRFMTYNLLNYGATKRFCDTDCKDEQLKYILNYAKPDLLAVNEIGEGGNSATIYSQRILDNCLNINDTTDWKVAPIIVTTGQGITNGLFYNSKKFGVKQLIRIQNQPRLNLYECYFNDKDLATKDTIFFHVCVVHLKASSAEEAARALEVKDLRNSLDKIKDKIQNLYLMGDCNLESASEDAFKLLTEGKTNIDLRDPLNQIGSWSDNEKYKNIMTQCTRKDNEADGGSSGGNDDRFDFILCNDAVINNTKKINYKIGTYHTIGQDGSFFQNSVLMSNNELSLKQALYKMSDHLPVIADFEIQGNIVSVDDPRIKLSGFNLYGNPVDDFLHLTYDQDIIAGSYRFSITSCDGKEWKNGNLAVESLEHNNIPVSELPAGLYILKIYPELQNSGKGVILKFIKR